jgi:hypothetical protein
VTFYLLATLFRGRDCFSKYFGQGRRQIDAGGINQHFVKTDPVDARFAAFEAARRTDLPLAEKAPRTC